MDLEPKWLWNSIRNLIDENQNQIISKSEFKNQPKKKKPKIVDDKTVPRDLTPQRKPQKASRDQLGVKLEGSSNSNTQIQKASRQQLRVHLGGSSDHNTQIQKTSRQQLQVKLEGSSDRSSPLWEISDHIPLWMKNYFAWHHEKRYKLTHEIWQHWKANKNKNIMEASGSKFLVVQCLQKQPPQQQINNSSVVVDETASCGTLLERLGLLPYWLKMAHETNRVLLIHWTVPTELTDFLVPPVGGFDWRAPTWIQQMLLDDKQGVLLKNETQLLEDSSFLHNFDSEFLLRVQVKHSFDFEKNYDNLRNATVQEEEASFRQVFHDVWAILFRPTATIRKMVVNAIGGNHGMEVGRYTSVEFTEIVTPEKEGGESGSIIIAKRAIRYIWKLLQKEPLMVITNATTITKGAIGINEKIPPIYARYKKPSKWAQKNGVENKREILHQPHIDFGAADFPTHEPHIYREIFVNLYVMALGRCVISYKEEGNNFARLASLIGYDSKCYFQLFRTESDTIFMLEDNSFLDYMFQPEKKYKGDAPSLKNYFREPMISDGADEMNTVFHQMELANGSGRGKDKLPEWMETYFAWHQKTRRQLDQSSVDDCKYLIVTCFESDDSCGGVSDRLKPLPMYVWEAYRSERLLLIWWERPKPLEEWLVPPSPAEGGVDWTVPSFLKEQINTTQKKKRLPRLTNWNQREAFRKEQTDRVVLYRVQSPSAGEVHYVEDQISYAKNASNSSLPLSPSLSTVTSYQDVFHLLFRRLFQPSQRLQKKIQDEMTQHSLIPGEYTAVHFRALYGNRTQRDDRQAVDVSTLGVNCASNLFPGVPVYFASDMAFAVDAAHAYGKIHNLPIVSLDIDQESTKGETESQDATSNDPIHFDKDPDWKSRTASAYDPTFMDLYLLAESRCVAYSNGGYGLFGSLLSHDPQCKMRFFQGRKKIKNCLWMNDNFERQVLKLPSTKRIVAGQRVQ